MSYITTSRSGLNSAVERAKGFDKIAGIDWSRFNQEWLTLGIGHPEVDKKTGQQVKDGAGRLKVALTGAGRTNTQKLIDYIREKAGLPPTRRRSQLK